MSELTINFNLKSSALAHLTSAVQFGFILGTLIFAILAVVDRFSPSKIFFICALLGAVFNVGIIADENSLTSIISLRFITGFFMAGIYPVGMKIAADYYEKGLGKSLGFLVGALVVGTAFPHLANDLTTAFPWQYVLISTSSLALVGGTLMLIVIPDGPYRKPGNQVKISAFFQVFRNREFSSVAFGYFGHMWELYAFWTFVPIILKTYELKHTEITYNTPLLSFTIIGIGGLACVLGGYLAQKYGTKRIASLALVSSFVCCLLSPLLFAIETENLFIGFLVFWGMVVVADSPLFSTLVVQSASPEIKGTALTIVNCIGFSLTIVSIQIINTLEGLIDPRYIYTTLALGPFLGLIALYQKNATPQKHLAKNR